MPSGGRRKGAGRPAGTGWKPVLPGMRAAAAEQMLTVVGSPRDPLAIVLDFANDQSLDVQTRLGACSIALPFLYPKLSSSQVNANVAVTKADPADLLRRLDERLMKLAASAATPDPHRADPPTLDGITVEEDEVPE